LTIGHWWNNSAEIKLSDQR